MKTMMSVRDCLRGLGMGALVLSMATLGARAVTAQTVDIGNASGSAGAITQFSVNLDGATGNVVAVTMKMDFTPFVQVPPKGTSPDCTFNTTLFPSPPGDKEQSSFHYFPAGCDPTATDPSNYCTRINVSIGSLGGGGNDPKAPIANGLLFNCNFQIPTSATNGMTFAITNTQSKVTAPNNQTTDVTAASMSGTVSVSGGGGGGTPTNTPGVPTNTPTVAAATNTPTVAAATSTPTVAAATSTPTKVPPTNTPVGGATNTPTVHATNTPVAPTNTPSGPTNTPGGVSPSVPSDDDGCNCRITSNGGDARRAWMVLIPVAALLVLRRRSR